MCVQYENNPAKAFRDIVRKLIKLIIIKVTNRLKIEGKTLDQNPQKGTSTTPETRVCAI